MREKTTGLPKGWKLIARTAPDLQGDKIDLDQLLAMYAMYSQFALPVTMFHDPMIPPRRMSGSVDIARTDGGDFALIGNYRLLDE